MNQVERLAAKTAAAALSLPGTIHDRVLAYYRKLNKPTTYDFYVEIDLEGGGDPILAAGSGGNKGIATIHNMSYSGSTQNTQPAGDVWVTIVASVGEYKQMLFAEPMDLKAEQEKPIPFEFDLPNRAGIGEIKAIVSKDLEEIETGRATFICATEDECPHIIQHDLIICKNKDTGKLLPYIEVRLTNYSSTNRHIKVRIMRPDESGDWWKYNNRGGWIVPSVDNKFEAVRVPCTRYGPLKLIIEGDGILIEEEFVRE